MKQCKKDFEFIKNNLDNFKGIDIEKYINIIDKIINDINDTEEIKEKEKNEIVDGEENKDKKE